MTDWWVTPLFDTNVAVFTVTSRDEIVVGDARKWMLPGDRRRSTQPTPFTGYITGVPVASITTGVDEALVLTCCHSVRGTSFSTPNSRVRFCSPLHCAAWTYSKSMSCRNVDCRLQSSKINVLCIFPETCNCCFCTLFTWLLRSVYNNSQLSRILLQSRSRNLNCNVHASKQRAT